MSYFPGSKYLFLFVYLFTFITGLPLNIAALSILVNKFNRKLLPVDILLANLTVSDLLLLTFLPFRMVEAAFDMHWPMPHVFCPLSAFMYFSSIYITSLFLMAISVERYLATAFPIRYKILRNPVYPLVGSIFIWCIATVHCSIVYIVEHIVPDNMTTANYNVCYSTFSPPQLEVLLTVRLEICIVLFCIPFMITIFCYGNFIKIIMWRSRLDKKRKIRAIGLVMATLINFIVCFMPYNVSHIVGFINSTSPDWRVYALLLSTFNASLDPIIFYFSSTSFKKSFLEGLVHVFKKLQFSKCWHKLCIAPCKKETVDINVSA
ncbi:free fatty acid receptor 3-like [Bufo gargarizans]|uniref:free fatty acid receptor 3-like n=1 Tax=Bufo gargarizans TaxID=30331 RepID=UPI001CF569E7|nr:free fatty acid receptor 3-like [Bufo gargarizans]